MKKYIRTKDGKFVEIIKIVNNIYVSKTNEYYYKDDILKQADIIDELIEAGDLIRAFATLDEVIRVSENRIETHFHLLKYGDVHEFYTKQGDNYILVAKTEDGKWKVI